MRGLRIEPKAAVLGNSRVDIGFDPDSERWPDAMRPVMNMGIPGDGTRRLAISYDYTVRRLQPETIFIGLDFFDFLFAVPPDPDFVLPLRSSSAGKIKPKLPELVLSTTALLDSVKTLRGQFDPDTTAMTDAGFNPMQDYEAIVRREGQWPMVDFKNRQHAEYLVERSRTLFLRDGTPAAPLVNLRRIFMDAARRGQRLVVFTYPMHAHFYSLVEISGRWRLYDRWKRAIVAEWQAARAKHPDWDSTFWDFALLTPTTTEPAPLPDHQDRRMKWYWEPGHFKARFGSVLIGQMTGSLPEGFGVRFAELDLEDHLARQRIALSAYMRSHPDDVAYLRDVCRQMGCGGAE